MKKEKIRAEQPCYPLCRNRLNRVCIKLPAIGLVSDNVYHLRDSRDPSSGEYRGESPIETQTPHLCPFSKPARSINRKVTDVETEDEEGEAVITESQQSIPLNLRQVIKKGLRSPAGITLACTYTGIALYYGTREVINYFQPQIPNVSKFATDFYEYIEPWINS